jgi:diguanylate cyclase (GGDEF)-like protein
MLAVPNSPVAEVASIHDILVRKTLHPQFQPIAKFADASLLGYEALMRGPKGSALQAPMALFAAARAVGAGVELELICCAVAAREFKRQGLPGKLFLKLGYAALMALVRQGEAGMQALLGGSEGSGEGATPVRIVVEVTEQGQAIALKDLLFACNCLRQGGIEIALDAFGGSGSNLQLWAEIAPDVVKIDRYFVHEIDKQPARFAMVRAMQQLAASMGCEMVAAGIEREAELAVLRDLGIGYGQGYLIGYPESKPAQRLQESASHLLRSTKIAVHPRTEAPRSETTARQLLIPAPVVPPTMSNERLEEFFKEHPELHAVAVVDDGQPIGLINRRSFLDRYAQRYHKELFGRRGCARFMNTKPLLVEHDSSLEAMTDILRGDDQRYLADGYIIVEGGRYLGLGTGEELVHVVTELRIEAARHANPLTFLPGNIPISEHIARLLASGTAFTACYFDLNNFKPYNDLYGYWRGDEMIRLAANVITRNADPLRDFVGHVGGDDFVALFQSDDALLRCQRIVDSFNSEARQLFDAEELAKDGIHSDDRRGNPTFFPLTTIAIGVVEVRSGLFGRAEDVASAAASAKRQAKKLNQGVHLLAVEESSASAATALRSVA